MADVIHISLTGIKGESTHQRHRDEIAVESWAWGLTAATTASAGGAAAGRPAFAPLSFAHRVDTASPPLWRACATGQHIAEGVLSVARPMATGGDYITLRMQGVVVTSVNLADTSADIQPPLEAVTLTCSQFEYTYRPQLANGSFGPAVVLKYDIAHNHVL